jgi:hypothetical protein
MGSQESEGRSRRTEKSNEVNDEKGVTGMALLRYGAADDAIVASARSGLFRFGAVVDGDPALDRTGWRATGPEHLAHDLGRDSGEYRRRNLCGGALAGSGASPPAAVCAGRPANFPAGTGVALVGDHPAWPFLHRGCDDREGPRSGGEGAVSMGASSVLHRCAARVHRFRSFAEQLGSVSCHRATDLRGAYLSDESGGAGVARGARGALRGLYSPDKTARAIFVLKVKVEGKFCGHDWLISVKDVGNAKISVVDADGERCR